MRGLFRGKHDIQAIIQASTPIAPAEDPNTEMMKA